MGQGSWAVLSNSGNPLPAVVFPGTPEVNNYSYVLSSPWLDGKELQCSTIWLDFDLKKTVVNPTGNENFIVEKFTGTDWDQLFSVKNDSSTGWKHYHLPIPSVNRHFFKIGFFATGLNSANIGSWNIDNIFINFVCNPPLHLTDSVESDTVFLSWSRPSCGKGMMDMVYDDGNPESYWGINPSTIGWLGNEFPVSPMTGVIKSFTLYFFSNTCPQSLTIDIFDANKNFVASTIPFIPQNSYWTTVPANNIPFNGKFYAMVHYDHQCTEWLGDDENGPYALEDLAWYYNDTTWQKLSEVTGTASKTFLLRANAYIDDSKMMKTIVPGKENSNIITANDSMVIAGYNIFRRHVTDQYFKVNTSPVQSLQFKDVVYSSFYPYSYYVTADYLLASTNNFLCESAGTDTITLEIVTDSRVKEESLWLKVFPVPAFKSLNISSQYLIDQYQISDLLGRIIKSEVNLMKNQVEIDITPLPAGIYILKAFTERGVFTRKLTVKSEK